MMRTFEYKGFVARVDFKEEAYCWEGKVTNLEDLIRFTGLSPEQADQAFQYCVDTYLMVCQKRGIKPNQPQSHH